mmetsp:Transcript_9722/g.20768  ORF Transcript_9722/g.20768 Transcript_9722/m.20768 type:complete len:90 (-) Transcript_9722:8-277(-)
MASARAFVLLPRICLHVGSLVILLHSSSRLSVADFVDKHHPDASRILRQNPRASEPRRVTSIHNARTVVGSICLALQPVEWNPAEFSAG